VEQAVRSFPRYHKYSVGTDLRKQSMGLVRLIPRTDIGRYNVKHCLRYPAAAVKKLCQRLRKAELAYQLTVEEGYLRGGMKKRVLRQLYYPRFPQTNSNQWSSNSLQSHLP
jgi:hypothetical protein